MPLKRGSKGDAVKQVQTALKGRGFNPGQIDGDFGPGTEKAVKEFQSGVGLNADGVVGEDTWSALGLPGQGADAC